MSTSNTDYTDTDASTAPVYNPDQYANAPTNEDNDETDSTTAPESQGQDTSGSDGYNQYYTENPIIMTDDTSDETM